MSKDLDQSTLDELAKFDSATISNAIESFNVRDRIEGYASMEIKCQFPTLPPMVGFAVTCTMDSTTSRPRQPSRIGDSFDTVIASQKPVIIVAKDVGNDNLRSCFFGDMICAALQSLGATGVITDGGVRDLAGIQKNAPGFHVFSPGVVVSHGNIYKLEFNIPVTVGGLEIHSGDLLHGDENGIVNIPFSVADKLSEEAARIKSYEDDFFKYVSGESATREGIEKLFY